MDGPKQPGDFLVEFVARDEVIGLLGELGVHEVVETQEHTYLELSGNEDIVHLHLAASGGSTPPREGASVILVDAERLAHAVELIIHKLRLNQIILFPVAKWRNVFDAVAFSLAENEEWQAVDTAATVELNSRDPLLCEPGDFRTLNALIQALLKDGEGDDQGLLITTTATPLVVRLVPDGTMLISVGNAVLADEVAETFSN